MLVPVSHYERTAPSVARYAQENGEAKMLAFHLEDGLYHVGR